MDIVSGMSDEEYPAEAIAAKKGLRVVVKCGGTLIENGATGDAVLDDLVCLKRAGLSVSLVHGGGVQADRDMEAAGIVPQRHRGLRITCDRTIEILSRCFGRLNEDIVAKIREKGVPAVGFSAPAGRLVLAEVMRIDDVDLGNVGDVTGVDMDMWRAVPPDAVAIVSSLGTDTAGRTLNINADYVATRLARLTGADDLVLMTDVDGVMLDQSDPSTRIPLLTLARARELIDDGTISRGMIPKIESALRAVGQGLGRVHIINGRKPHSLLTQIFGAAGAGTTIVRE